MIFDMGGVILPSPFNAAYKWEAENGLEKGSIFKAISHHKKDGAGSKLERGELSLEQFYFPFTKEVSNVHTGTPITEAMIESFMDTLSQELNAPNADVMNVVKNLKLNGIKTGVLTNNWVS